MNRYSLSWDGRTYHGEYETKQEAEQAGFDDEYSKERGWFWVGECVPPAQPEDLWHAEDWLEHVSCQDEYCAEWAEDWDQSTREQREELDREVRGVMAAWLDRHGLRPQFWNIETLIKWMSPMTNKLKPCPFCGNSEPRAAVTDISPGYQTSLVRCRTCPAEICKTGIDAADYWNRRPTVWRNCESDPPPVNRYVLVRYPGSGHEFIWYHYRLPEPGLVYDWCEVPE